MNIKEKAYQIEFWEHDKDDPAPIYICFVRGFCQTEALVQGSRYLNVQNWTGPVGMVKIRELG